MCVSRGKEFESQVVTEWNLQKAAGIISGGSKNSKKPIIAQRMAEFALTNPPLCGAKHQCDSPVFAFT